MKIAEMVKMFLDSRRRGTDGARKRCSSKTLEVYTRNLKHFESFLLSENAADSILDYQNLRRGTILALVDWVQLREKEKVWAKATCLQFWRCLKSFFKWVLEDEDCVAASLKSFAKYLPAAEKCPRREYIPMTVDLKKFRNSYETHKPYAFRNYVAFSLLLDTGIRNSEMCGLKLKDVLLEEGLLIVDGKTGRRAVPITDATIKLLKAWFRRRDETVYGQKSEYVFISKYGEKLTANGFGQNFRKMQAKHGLPKISPHTLRHSFATHYLSNGGSLERLRNILGHSSFEMTKEYLHTAKINDRGAREELERCSVVRNL